MHAVIVAGGKQYNVSEGDIIYVEKQDVNEGDSVVLDKVIALVDGENSTFGTPYIEGANVEATVVKNGKSPKVMVYKMKPKKNYRRKYGHRQPYTKLQINTINA